MRILITADLHFGVPGKLEHCLWAARVMREYAHQQDIKVVMVLGDLFHDRVNLNIEVLCGAYSFFSEIKENYDQEWLIFPGNHDMFLRNSWDVNSIRVLKDLIVLVEDIGMVQYAGRRFWIIPFIHYEDVYMKALASVEEKYQPGDILLTHIGVRGATMNECYLFKNWGIVDFTTSKFQHVFTGHFHCYQRLGSVIYPGSPIPLRFDEGTMDHGFLVFNTETNETEFVEIFETGKGFFPDEPLPHDYITAYYEDLKDEDFKLAGCKVRAKLSRDYTTNELHEIREKLLSRGAVTVSWIREKERDVDLTSKVKTLDLRNPANLLEAWWKHDSPENLDKDFLFKINHEIIEESKID